MYSAIQGTVVALRVNAPERRLGAGVVVGEHEIMTARHLVVDVDGAVDVLLADGRHLEARVRGTDARTDLALLAVDEPLPSARMADAHHVRVGDTVFAVGNPYGLPHSVTVGVVGAKHRRLTSGTGPEVGFLQLSIPLNPGNSGGPIFDLDGRLVGLLTGTHTEGQAIAFAVPTDTVVAALPALRSGADVSRGFLGLRVAPTEDGVRVVSIIPTGPADLAGVRPDDVLTAFDGVPIGAPQDLYTRLDQLPGDHATSLRLLRDGTLHVLEVELADWALQPVAIAGMTLRPHAGSGGRVVAVRPRSRADEAGVQIGDLVRTVDGLPLQAPADVRSALSPTRAARIGLERDGVSVQAAL